MHESAYYPAGAYEDPRAPWNQVSPPEREFDVTISQTLSKSTSIYSDCYDMECDEDGSAYTITDDTDWKDEFLQSEHYTPLQLIQAFKNHLQNDIHRYGDTINKKHYEFLMRECENWVEDDYEVIED